MSLGVLSDAYLALYELKEYGPVRANELIIKDRFISYQSRLEIKNTNYKYLNYLLKTGQSHKLNSYYISSEESLLNIVHSDGTLRYSDKILFKISSEGTEYIKKEIAKRKNRFHIKSWHYFLAFISMIVGYESGFTSLEKEIANLHNGFRENKLTKQAEKFLTKKLGYWLQNSLSKFIWSEELGPNLYLYNGYKEHDFSDWKKTLEYDFKIVHCVPGIAPIIIPILEEYNRPYAALLFSSDSVSEAIEKIKIKQKENSDLYPFCQ